MDSIERLNAPAFFRHGDYGYYRSPNGLEYEFFIVEEYDDLIWHPGCGREIHPFQFNWEERLIPPDATPDDPDPEIVRIVEAQIGEYEAEEIPFRLRHGPTS